MNITRRSMSSEASSSPPSVSTTAPPSSPKPDFEVLAPKDAFAGIAAGPSAPANATAFFGLKSATQGSKAAQAQDAFVGDPAEACAMMDAYKLSAAEILRLEGSLEASLIFADEIAKMHNKPHHAQEVHAMAERLLVDASLQRDVKRAASLIVVGEYKSPAVLMRGGRLTDDEKKSHIFPINQRAAELLRSNAETAPYADAIEGKQATELTSYLHGVRDISAMAAPRAWRRDEKHPDGSLFFEEIAAEMRSNNQRPGRDARVTEMLLNRYKATQAVAQ